MRLSKPTLKHAAALCCAVLLLACADTVTRLPMSAQAAAASADEAYVIARSQHMALRFADAALSYQAALAALPGHVAARNGLAALKAEQGDLAGAISVWSSMTAEEGRQAGGGYLFANLGHAYFLQGNYQAALGALEQACVLDPLNHRAWERLGSTLEQLGRPERAARMKRQAATLRAHDLSADYAMAAPTRVAALDFAVRAGADPDAEDGWDRTEVREVESGMLVLQRIKAAKERAVYGSFELPATALASRITIAADGTAALEIRNGNGISGAARALAGTVGNPALRVVRLSNHKGYGVQRTRVEYRPAYRAAAERLAERVGATRVVAVEQLERADVRLVLGRDLGRPVGNNKVAAAPALALRPKPAPQAG